MKFTDEQRLIVIMLADIQKSMKLGGEFDPDFIKKVAIDGHEFAIPFEHSGAFSSSDHELPEEFRFVINVLDMWSFIEDGLKNLDSAGRAALEAAAGKFALTAKFDGFDGNGETELMAYTRLLVDDLNRFSEFRGRNFNSHSMRAARYAAMHSVFEPIRDLTLGERELNAEELAQILTAKWLRE
ncbi:YfbU family protein [Stenotrophomonas maltophilia]|uniref:YfbU family protein n=1 Tax=Stenotrophomonas maltophilia group sp. Smal13 TaxID=3377166 RepID=UPI0013117023|nr:YfbU family protein [Stenotrophomonas maltophilia]EKU9957554.1 YfbU family protein [Stenotrophomonas maltophilia]EKU9984461.1 YfbU family protein [Stenotrophomonas maltophilia]